MLGSFCNRIFSSHSQKFFYLRMAFIEGPFGLIFLFIDGYLREFWRHFLHSIFSSVFSLQFTKLYVKPFQEIPFVFFNANEVLSCPRLQLFSGSFTYCLKDLQRVLTMLKERHYIVFVTNLMCIALKSTMLRITILINPHFAVILHYILVYFW